MIAAILKDGAVSALTHALGPLKKSPGGPTMRISGDLAE